VVGLNPNGMSLQHILSTYVYNGHYTLPSDTIYADAYMQAIGYLFHKLSDLRYEQSRCRL